MLTDHQPVNHQETERSGISEITDSVIVNAIKPKEQCAQNIISVSQDQRAQTNISILNTNEIEVEIHSEEIGAQHVVHFRDAQDRSDTGSLITQAPQSSSIHATINALSTWISAVQPCESWYLAGWIKDSPIDFLVDPGAVVSAISLQCYEKLVDADARIFYVHMDDLKHCAPPDPEPSWPDVARGTSIVVSTRAPSTLAPTDIVRSHQTSDQRALDWISLNHGK